MLTVPTLRIRPATPTDLDVYRTLAIQSFVEKWSAVNTPEDLKLYTDKAFSIEAIADDLTNPARHVILAFADDRAAGYVKLVQAPNPEAPPAQKPIELERLYLLQSFVGQKIGGALMTEALTFARDQACDVMWLGVWEHNHQAMPFYTRWGFEIYGSHAFSLGNSVDTDLLLKLDLRRP